jgi:hypothetical protein
MNKSYETPTMEAEVSLGTTVGISTVTPAECSVFVQIWVDTNAIQAGSTNGVYLIDSNQSSGSSKEGSPLLNTHIPTNSKICWQLVAVNKNWKGELSIQNFSNSGVFGASGTPKRVDATTWTGQVQDNGSDNYQIIFNVQQEGGSGISVTVNPTLTVTNQ